MAELAVVGGGGAMPPPKLISYLSSLLQRVADSNDLAAAEEEGEGVSVFHGVRRPGISVRSYLERIFKYANCSPACFVVAYVYLDRFTHRHRSILINSFNVHRLLITSVMVAAKFMDDIKSEALFWLGNEVMACREMPLKPAKNVYYNNAYYAKVGGISTREMNLLEVDFLFGLGFHLNLTPATFHSYCAHLHAETLLLRPSPPPPPSPLNDDLIISIPNTYNTTTTTTTISSSSLAIQKQQHPQLAV
ncbi:unnamed protein product [Cuscuta campestris]|uniref:Cyclin n=1 Tax=Cuscuta campestris TaxID=132261 RepID=A0A484N2T9_9ASTE|nr:unnamed protein product [Cuscuta campestris]